MFACAACGMDCVCLRCARLCHRGHAIAPCTRRRRVLCQCGMRCADLLSSAACGSSAQGAPPCRLEVPLCDSDGGSDALDFKYAAEVERRWDAAQCVQRFIRGHLARLRAAALWERKRQRGRQAAEAFWNERVLGPIMAKVAGLVSAAQLANTRATMQRADAYSLFVARYRRLQPCLQAMDLCRDAVSALLISPSAQLLTARAAADPRVLSGAADAQRVAVWSTAAARQHERMLPPKLRMTQKHLLQATRRLPAPVARTHRQDPCHARAFEQRQWCVPDPDVRVLMSAAMGREQRLYAPPQGIFPSHVLAAPQGLFRRVCHSAARQRRLLHARRSASVAVCRSHDACALPLAADKTISRYDAVWRQLSDAYGDGASASVDVAASMQRAVPRLDSRQRPGATAHGRRAWSSSRMPLMKKMTAWRPRTTTHIKSLHLRTRNKRPVNVEPGLPCALLREQRSSHVFLRLLYPCVGSSGRARWRCSQTRRCGRTRATRAHYSSMRFPHQNRPMHTSIYTSKVFTFSSSRTLK
eukprot:TRINITY_DN13504_c0_g1_i9.p1 TRINITY_DN13504_c0_g1~~TRINITY_DN13504_c0_g1_i9.p1  ORF type:complete len:612 (-),score=106.69 TRINITY_DN13504_c0_g1_i9:2412-3995(-)